MSARFPTRPLAYGLGLLLMGLSAAWLTRPEQLTLLASGPLIEGHAKIACVGCHVEAPGTTRQQLQANARHLLGLRERGADFVHAPITNDDCDAWDTSEDMTFSITDRPLSVARASDLESNAERRYAPARLVGTRILMIAACPMPTKVTER